MEIVVDHPVFGPYAMAFPIKWTANPFDNKNWLHHFNSLRWLRKEEDLIKVEKSLRSFYNFHCIKNIKNPYYSEIRGDHTAAIRLTALVELKNRFEYSGVISGVGICQKLIKNELVNLQRPEMYRAGHNHALMVDLALLEIFKDRKLKFQHLIDLDMILRRSAQTINDMWHFTGLTKEHSVSYQEYNLPITVKFYKTIEELGLEDKSNVLLENIINETKKFLGYALKENGEYFSLGDTLRKPNANILNKVYKGKNLDRKTPAELLLPYSKQDGTYCNNNFFIFRKLINGRKIHFAATCCWDSQNHKQNDELSFCLDVDGISIFDDPGFTPFLPKQQVMDLKSEKNHSTITIEKNKWCANFSAKRASKIVKGNDFKDGFEVEMKTERVPDLIFTRNIKLSKDVVIIKDRVSGLIEKDTYINRLFVLGPKVCVNKDLIRNRAVLSMGAKLLAEVSCESTGVSESFFYIGNDVDYVLVKKDEVVKTNTLMHKGKAVAGINNRLMTLKIDLI